jgi:hypothetical protein
MRIHVYDSSQYTLGEIVVEGGELTGPLYLVVDPENPNDAVNKKYVDEVIQNVENELSLVSNGGVDVTLYGPTSIDAGATAEYIITNYDMFSTYVVNVDYGTAVINGDKITVIAPTDQNTIRLTVSRNGGNRYVDIPVNGAVVVLPDIETPVILYPGNNATDLPTSFNVQISDYNSPTGKQWNSTAVEVSDTPDFSNTVYYNELYYGDTYTTPQNTIPVENLLFGKTYYIKVAYSWRDAAADENYYFWSDVFTIATISEPANAIYELLNTYISVHNRSGIKPVPFVMNGEEHILVLSRSAPTNKGGSGHTNLILFKTNKEKLWEVNLLENNSLATASFINAVPTDAIVANEGGTYYAYVTGYTSGYDYGTSSFIYVSYILKVNMTDGSVVWVIRDSDITVNRATFNSINEVVYNGSQAYLVTGVDGKGQHNSPNFGVFQFVISTTGTILSKSSFYLSSFSDNITPIRTRTINENGTYYAYHLVTNQNTTRPMVFKTDLDGNIVNNTFKEISTTTPLLASFDGVDIALSVENGNVYAYVLCTDTLEDYDTNTLNNVVLFKFDSNLNYVWSVDYADTRDYNTNNVNTYSPAWLEVDPRDIPGKTIMALGFRNYFPTTGESDIFFLKFTSDGNYSYAKTISASPSIGSSLSTSPLLKASSTVDNGHFKPLVIIKYTDEYITYFDVDEATQGTVVGNALFSINTINDTVSNTNYPSTNISDKAAISGTHPITLTPTTMVNSPTAETELTAFNI